MTDANALAEQAEAYVVAGEFEPALQCYVHLLEAEPERMDIAVRAGDIAMDANEFELAERFYHLITRYVPDNAAAHLQRSHALRRLGRVVEAREEVMAVLDIMPDLIAAQRYLGFLHHALCDFDQAIAAFELVVEADPDDAEAWLSYGEALTSSYSRFDEGRAAINKATSLAPDNRGLLLTAADRFIVDGRFAEAEALLRKIIISDTEAQTSPMPNIWLALALGAQGKHREAEYYYLTAMKCSEDLISRSSPIEAVAYRTITAFTLYHLGRHKKVDDIFESLCQGYLTPDEFIYDHQSYLPNTYERIQQLTKIVGGRDVALLLYGPSIAELADCVDQLDGLDICYASVNKFDVVEDRILGPIDQTLDIVVTANPNDMGQRWDAYHEFLTRPDDNLLVTTNYALSSLRPPFSVDRHFAKVFDDKLLFFDAGSRLPTSPVAPIHFFAGNTLSIALPMLALAGPRRIFIFGADGGASPPGSDDDAAYFFGATAEIDETARRRREACRRFKADAALCDHNAAFAALAATKFFRIAMPEIYNCCPHSNYQSFARISCADGIRMLREPDV